MYKLLIINFVFFAVLIANYSPAIAYIGPGMGGGFLTAIIGIVIAILAGIFGIIWFPIKRLINKRKNKNKEDKKQL
jgi:hypothetical protein